MRIMRRGAAIAAFALCALTSTAGAEEMLPNPDPCAVSPGLCDGGSELYHAVGDLLAAEPGDGAAGLLLAALEPAPNAEAVWAFPRALEPIAAQPLAADAAAAPAADLPRIDAPSIAFVLASGEALAEPAFDAASGVAAPSLPEQPRALAADLVAGVGTVQVPALPPLTPTPTGPILAERVAPPRAPSGLASSPHAAAAPAEPAYRVSGEAARMPGPLAAPLPAPRDPSATAPPPGGPLLAFPWLPELDLTPGLAAALAVLWLLVLVPPLYSRIARDRLLDHPVRARLGAVVAARPGINIEDLAREAGCSRSTAVYHLHLMVRHGALLALGAAKSTHYYPNNGRHDAEDRERRAALASARARSLCARICANPGITRQELMALEDISASTLSWHLGRILALRLIEDRPVPKGRGLYPGHGLREILEPWRAPEPAAPAASLGDLEVAEPLAPVPAA